MGVGDMSVSYNPAWDIVTQGKNYCLFVEIKMVICIKLVPCSLSLEPKINVSISVVFYFQYLRWSLVYLWDQLTVTTIWNTGETGDIDTVAIVFCMCQHKKRALKNNEINSNVKRLLIEQRKVLDTRIKIM